MLKILVVMLLAAASLTAGTAAAQATGNTLARIKSAKAINVAYSPDSFPFSAANAGSDPSGYSIELCKRVITQIGRAVGEPALKVNWLSGSVTERLQMVASGRADLECANTTQTQSRLANVDFSNLIFIDGGGFLVKAGSPINAISDLSGKKVAVLKGTTTEARLGAALSQRLVNATIVPITDAAQGVAMLEAGTTDAYATRSSSSALPCRRKSPRSSRCWPRTSRSSRTRWRCRATIPRCGSKSTRHSRRSTWVARSTRSSLSGWASSAVRARCSPPCTCSTRFPNKHSTRRYAMTQVSAWRRCAAAFAAIATLALGACSTPPAFQVSEPSARVGTVESITQDAVQNMNTTAGTIGGALIGGGLGSLIGGGTGQVVAAVVGATGGAYLGNQAAQRSQTLVWRIAVRYDDGSVASIQQTSAPNLRIGDRVRVTQNGIELLR
jgi:ABC-type amino acid transport substrate-binding protein/outer membrane lipoprotein SlyB